MRTYQPVRFRGAEGEVIEEALIDTGASISLIPRKLAIKIGAWHTNQTINIVGIHRQSRVLPLGVVRVYFPSLNNIGGHFTVAVSDNEKEPIIGMDILRSLGISIDTTTSRLQVKNEIWEAFKTLSAFTVGGFLIIKALDAIFKEKEE